MGNVEQKYLEELRKLEEYRDKMRPYSAVCTKCLEPIMEEWHICKEVKDGTEP